MLKQFLTLLSFTAITTLFAQGTFPPAAGQAGTTAISKDSTIVQSWATGIDLVRGYVQISDTSVYYAGTNLASYGQPSAALHMAENAPTGVVSLGDGGMATLTFDRLIVNGPGPDFAVFGNSTNDNFLELAFVEVSSDGINFSRFPSVSLTQTTTQTGTSDELDPQNLHNLAGKYRKGFGVPFDLSELPNSSLVNKNTIRFIRITDVKGSIDPLFASKDSQGNIINDPFPTPVDSAGFDLDGIAVINSNVQNTLVTFNELILEEESHYLPYGDSLFTSGPLSFQYDGGEGFWSGFTYSNLSNINNDYAHDQFVAASLSGMDGNATNYVVSYISSDWASGTYDPIPSEIKVINENAVTFSGFYVNNTHIAYTSLRDGSAFNKKFGGETGDDPDWFKLSVWGIRSDNSTTSKIEHYLADFRSRDNSRDYIQNGWRWVDLKSLGEVTALRFELQSTDNGDYGMNTPAYFCMDNLSIMQPQGAFISNPIDDLYLEINAIPVNIELTDHFNASGAELTFEIASNSDAALVTTIISGSLLNLTFTPDFKGVSEISVVASANGISVEDMFLVAVGSELGVDENFSFRPKVYPNPASGHLIVEGVKGANLRLYNSNGSLVFEQTGNIENTTLSLDHLNAGIYMLQIYGPEGSSTVKISKK
ncbi:MAG: DUF4465 domain-containing protein [Lentimicrobium sp.]|jgi:hypothetical protein|nr:DUF4465 domain-containing protein [Lentimicrobium sp.]